MTAAAPHPATPDAPAPRFLTREEGRQLVDERARRFLGMGLEEFRRRLNEGTLDDSNEHVLGIRMILPLAD